MKWPKGDSKYTKIAVYAILTATAIMIISKLISASEDFGATIISFFAFLYKAIKPIVAGMVIAYILYSPIESIEKGMKKIFKKDKFSKFINAFSLIVIFLLVISIIVLAIYFIIPSVAENLTDLFNNIPEYYETVNEWYLQNIAPSELISNEYTQQAIQNGIETFNESVNEFLVIGLSGIASFTYSVVSGIITATIALIISFYLVAGRKKISNEIMTTTKAYLGKKRTASIKKFLMSVNNVFGKYISAKIVEILIVFVLCQIAFLLIGVPYSTLMALIVALTNVVPFIGPIVGMIPPVVLTLLESPIQSLWVFGSIIVIQAIDAYIIQPFFIGDKMGISPFWVIVSVIVGGGLFGIWGILLSVPVAAVIKISVKNYIERRNLKAEAEAEMKN